MTDKYAVLGNPISHSKSPQIHSAFAKQTNHDISYDAILAPLEGFTATVLQLITAGYKGVNVTVPFKFDAYDLCDTLTARAQVAGAVNTLKFQNSSIAGDNTDGIGLVNDIVHNLGVSLKGARILLLGAGGAAQGVLQSLLDAQPASITVANRNLDKAKIMIQRLGEVSACEIRMLDFYSLNQAFDVVINATSASLSNEKLPVADAIFGKNTLAYDMMYGRETPFMAQARAAGAQVADGLGMLVEQAAEAFYLWREVRPATQPVIEILRADN